MATTRRDYYEILGVPRGADEKAIKSAFRRLARELHPDVNDHPEAQERFREAAEAYEVLSKRETRDLYDRFGHEGLRTGGFHPTDFGNLADLFSVFFGDELFGGFAGRPGAGPRGAPTSSQRWRSSSLEAARKTTRTVPFPVAVPARPARAAGPRRARARPLVRAARARGGCSRSRRPCSASSCARRPARSAAASGEVVETPCPDCAGAGRATETRELEVQIPAGIHDGQRIRLAGEGHAGVLGGRAGDAYVLVRVRPDPRFVREGDDIISAVDLTLTQAALGARVEVPDPPGGRRARVQARAPSRGTFVSSAARGCPCCRDSVAATTGSS